MNMEGLKLLARPRPAITHKVKTWPVQYDAVDVGEKLHEVRTFDRDYQVGDSLMLEKWDPLNNVYLGPRRLVDITHITWPGTWGLPMNIGVLSVRRAEGDELI